MFKHSHKRTRNSYRLFNSFKLFSMLLLPHFTISFSLSMLVFHPPSDKFHFLCSHFSILQLVVNRRRIQKFCWFTRSNYMDSISYKGWNDLFSFHSSHSLPFTFAIYFPLPILYFCKYYIFASSLLPHASLLLVSSIISISSFFSIFPYTSCSRTNSIWLRI